LMRSLSSLFSTSKLLSAKISKESTTILCNLI
jgi:hypothetical protein